MQLGRNRAEVVERLLVAHVARTQNLLDLAGDLVLEWPRDHQPALTQSQS